MEKLSFAVYNAVVDSQGNVISSLSPNDERKIRNWCEGAVQGICELWKIDKIVKKYAAGANYTEWDIIFTLPNEIYATTYINILQKTIHRMVVRNGFAKEHVKFF